MAIRVRKDGTLVCAALNPEFAGDTYLDDTIHHELCMKKLIIAEPEPEHSHNGGFWWWSGNPPKGIKIDDYWRTK